MISLTDDKPKQQPQLDLAPLLDCLEIDTCNKAHLELLITFYNDIYLNGFPDINQRETLENILAPLYHRNREHNRHNNFHVIIAMLHGEVVGGIIADYFAEINSGAIEFIAVAESARHHHAGSLLVNRLHTALLADAFASGHRQLDYVFVEAENPKTVPEFPGDFDPNLRLQFWKKQNFRCIDFNYYLPKLSPDKEDVLYLLLGVDVLNRHLPYDTIPVEIVMKFIHLYTYYGVRIEQPEENDEIKAMHAELAGRKNLDIIDFE